MAWYSILPSHLTSYETWIIRICIILAIINLSPWILAILYDLILYIARRVWHEFPIIGGRARGERRPRAPSLRDRARRMSIAEIFSRSSSSPPTVRERGEEEKLSPGAAELRRRSATGQYHQRRDGHLRSPSTEDIEEEDNVT